MVLTWYRAYDAEAGRWLSADPIGEEGGLNLYGYVNNGSVNLVDRYGDSPAWGDFRSLPGYTGPSSLGLGGRHVPITADSVQKCLDGVGLIPGLGEFADGINAAISAFRGNWGDAGLSIASMIPFAGWAATGAKWGDDATAVIKLAKEAERKSKISPICETDAKQLQDWADEYGVPSRGPEVHPNRPHGKEPHIHINEGGHIWIK